MKGGTNVNEHDENLSITVQMPRDQAEAFRKLLLELNWNTLRGLAGTDAEADVLHFALSRFQIALMDTNKK